MPARLSLLLLATMLLGLPASAEADVVIEGTKRIQAETTADFGDWAHYTTWRHKVAEGDTLSQIAQQHLGASSRWKEITALNKGLTPETLEAGSTIVMPPRKVPAGREGAAPNAGAWMDVFAAPGGGFFGDGFVPLQHGEKVPFHRYGTSLIAVRHDLAADLQKAIANRAEQTSVGQVLKTWADKPGFAISEGRVGGYETVDEDSPVARVYKTIRIEKIADGKIALKVLRTQRLDKEGEPVEGLGLIGIGRWMLLLVAFAALLAIVFVARRRSQDVQVPIRAA